MYIYMCECYNGTGKFVQCSDNVRVSFSASGSSRLRVSYGWYLRPLLPTHLNRWVLVSELHTATVAEVIGDSGHCNGRKRKHYTAFSDESRAAIGRHATAAVNSNVNAL